MSGGPNHYGSIGIANGDGEPGTPPPVDGGSEHSERRPLLAEDPPPAAAPSPAALASRAWSSLTFGWIGPLLEAGNRAGRLDVEDLAAHPLPADCRTEAAHGRFLSEWTRELAGDGGGEAPGEGGDGGSEGGGGGGRHPSLIRALGRSFGPDFLRAGLLKLVHDANLFVGPQVLNRLINFLRNPGAGLSAGLALTFVVVCSQIVMSFTLRHYFYKCYTVGLRMRTAVVVAIYRKSLVLSLRERHAHGGAGEIANLVGIDAQRIQDLMTYLHAVWYSFFQIGLAMYFLWGQVGASCLAGVVVIIIMIPLTKFIASWLGRVQKRLMKARDDRVALNNEILGAMRVIKIQAWEENFRSKLMELRDHELSRLRHYFVAGALSVTMYGSAPLMVALATFAAYTLSGNNLDVAEALTALALFDIIRFPMFMLPQIINRLVEAGLSFERVREFLCCEEYSKVGEGKLKEDGEVWMNKGTFVYDSKKPRLGDGKDRNHQKGIGGLIQQQRRLMQEAALDRKWEAMLLKAQLKDAEDKIAELQKQINPGLVCSLSDADLQIGDEEDDWTPSSLLSLRRVCMHIRRGEFVAVVGAVGSGKSTLINSILGEGRPLYGSELAVKGKLGAFLQTPFIMNDTVRNNILFGHVPTEDDGNLSAKAAGEAVDEARYQLSLNVSSLLHDLKLLSHGDQTEIGEKGITLSGGQKARVALARAVYHDADVYLLDDPLAAVDAHVGKDLFHKCIVDELLLGTSKRSPGDNNGANKSDDKGKPGWSASLFGGPSTSSSNTSKPERNTTVILVTNALQHLSHPLLDRIIVLGDGCVEEVGTFVELSSNPESRFSSFLSVMAESSAATLDEGDGSESVEIEDLSDEDDDKDALDLGNEPEVEEVIHPNRSPARTLTRRKSSVRKKSVGSASDLEEKVGTLMTDEFKERVTGSVDKEVYIAWAKAGGGLSIGVAVLGLFAVGEILSVTSKWWLTAWSGSGDGSRVFYFLGIYALVNFSAIASTFVRIMLFITAGLRASRLMFVEMTDAVLNAPMSFFDTTPIGRIVNRFSKDMYTIDEQLVLSGRSYLATMANVFSTIFVVVTITPAFLIGLVPIIIFYLHQQNFYMITYRELKRLDSITRSPIYALLGESIDGVLTIRAFNAEDSLNKRMVKMVETQQTAYHLTFASQCWLSIRLEFAGTMIVMCACLVAVLEQPRYGGNEHFAGIAGLSISFALSVTQTLNWTVRMASDLEANMVAVERVQQYSQITSEATRNSPSDKTTNWPTEGQIEFLNVELKYRPGLPLVLKGLNISIPSMSKVGVVGRTGAGKSTLMVALLRIVELYQGSIKIDGVDIRSIGLKKLRSKIAVIPQDPVLFSGTIRTNLDPFGEYNDERLFEVLTLVGLYEKKLERRGSSNSLASLASSTDKGAGGRTQPVKSLSEEVSEGGTNFSVGQRQLLVIARAMLTGACIVIMDEATASVDADTDARIQRVFRSEFKNATCITVAHRLNTIMDSDYVLVMDNGQAAEFDKPSSLLTKEDGMFKRLVDAWEEEN